MPVNNMSRIVDVYILVIVLRYAVGIVESSHVHTFPNVDTNHALSKHKL